jgi:ABC-type multidrug transport system ATPase subunit
VIDDFDRVRVLDVSRHFGRRIALLATLATPNSGEILYGERSPQAWGPRLRQRIGLLAHELHLYTELTARQNLLFFAKLYAAGGAGAGVNGPRDASTLEDAVDAALERAGLTERGGDDVSGFSRGMRQRLALERALLHQPRLVLLDEPFTGLDDEAAAALAARLRALRDTGAVVVMATHDFESADHLVDRAVCLTEGRAREIPDGGGTLRERYRQSLREPLS